MASAIAGHTRSLTPGRPSVAARGLEMDAQGTLGGYTVCREAGPIWNVSWVR